MMCTVNFMSVKCKFDVQAYDIYSVVFNTPDISSLIYFIFFLKS